MNLFLRESRSNLKSFLIWSGCAVLLIIGVLAKYGGLSESDQNMNELVAQMPKALQIIMGGGTFDLTKISGYYGVTFGYLQLIGSIYAMILGANVISKEERDKTVEFLLTKPVERIKIAVQKLLASSLCILLFTVIVFLASVLGIRLFSDDIITRPVFLLCISLFLIMMVFSGLGALLAAIDKKPRRPGQIGTAVVFGTYFFSLAIQFSDSLAFLRPFTPIGYFDTAAVLNFKGLSVGYTVFSLILIVVLCTAALTFYKKRDMKI